MAGGGHSNVRLAEHNACVAFHRKQALTNIAVETLVYILVLYINVKLLFFFNLDCNSDIS
jgi:hypothetical protein